MRRMQFFLAGLMGFGLVGMAWAWPEALQGGGRFGAPVVVVGEKVYVFGGHANRGLHDSVEVFGEADGETTLLESGLLKRYFHTGAVYDGKVYLVGGYHLPLDGTTGTVFEEFDPATGSVRTLPPMPVEVHRAGSAVVGDKFYVIGGEVVPRRWGKLVQIYDFKTGTWSEGAPMPVAREGVVMTDGKKIYAPGGYNGSLAIRAFQVYDPETDTWEKWEQLPVKVSAHSGVIAGDYLFAFGDFEFMGRVVAYSFKNKSWRLLNAPYKPARHNGAVLLGDTVVVVGGNTGNRAPFWDYVQCYDSSALASGGGRPWVKDIETRPVLPTSAPRAETVAVSVPAVRTPTRPSRPLPEPPNPRFFKLKWQVSLTDFRHARMGSWNTSPRFEVRSPLLVEGRDVFTALNVNTGDVLGVVPKKSLPELGRNISTYGQSQVYFQSGGKSGMVISRSIRKENDDRLVTDILGWNEDGDVLWDGQLETERWGGISFQRLPLDEEDDILAASVDRALALFLPNGVELLRQAVPQRVRQWTLRNAVDGIGTELLVESDDFLICYQLQMPSERGLINEQIFQKKWSRPKSELMFDTTALKKVNLPVAGLHIFAGMNASELRVADLSSGEMIAQFVRPLEWPAPRSGGGVQMDQFAYLYHPEDSKVLVRANLSPAEDDQPEARIVLSAISPDGTVLWERIFSEPLVTAEWTSLAAGDGSRVGALALWDRLIFLDAGGRILLEQPFGVNMAPWLIQQPSAAGPFELLEIGPDVTLYHWNPQAVDANQK